MVVCCDDPEATRYASETLAMAGRGAVVSTVQGRWFSRLEAIRTGLHALAALGIEPTGQAYDVQLPEVDDQPEPFLAGRIWIFDADTVAIRTTRSVLDQIDPYSFGVVSGGNRDDLGFIVAGASILQCALAFVERGAFNGYGYEDSAIRVGCWAATGGAIVTVPPCWVRRNHSNAKRTENYEEPSRVSSVKNGAYLGRLITRLIERNYWQKCCSDCIPGQQFEIHCGEP